MEPNKEEMGQLSSQQQNPVVAEPLSTLAYFLDSQNLDSHKKLISLGYYYNRFGQLRSVASDSKFKFTNQAEYEEICNTMTRYIQDLLVAYYDMEEEWLPLPQSETKSANNIFISKDFYTNPDKCLVLIQGTGPVRAGIWARYCCMNESLDIGSVIPFLVRAKAEGYSSIILNPNLNNDPKTGEAIKGSETMDRHCIYVWERYIRKCPAKELYIVAHSAGGYCTGILLEQFSKEFMERVQMVALTDSYMPVGYDPRHRDFTQKRAYKFQAEKKMHGEALTKNWIKDKEFSAGHPKHEYATGYARNLIMDLFLISHLLPK